VSFYPPDKGAQCGGQTKKKTTPAEKASTKREKSGCPKESQLSENRMGGEERHRGERVHDRILEKKAGGKRDIKLSTLGVVRGGGPLTGKNLIGNYINFREKQVVTRFHKSGFEKRGQSWGTSGGRPQLGGGSDEKGGEKKMRLIDLQKKLLRALRGES